MPGLEPVRAVPGRTCSGFGDEGFLCEPSADHWAYDCSTGVDGRTIAAIDEIDVVGLHLYPDHWDTDPAWSTDYIERHLALGAQVGKPVFLGEYGWRGTDTRNAVRTDFPPVVDDDYLLLSAGRPGTLDLLANDVSLFSQLDRASVQLDSSPPGVSLADGRVSYQPPPGFSGVVEFTYTVADVQGRVSAPASVTIRLVTR